VFRILINISCCGAEDIRVIVHSLALDFAVNCLKFYMNNVGINNFVSDSLIDHLIFLIGFSQMII
jgi:hypothetical protein